MTYYLRVGDTPRKRHIRHKGLSEELMGEEGFRGASSLLYHRGSPSAITGVDAVDVGRDELAPNHPLLPWHVRAVDTTSGDLVTGRQVLFGNADVTIARATADRSSDLYRNAAGDELVYIQSGRATLESVFGSIAVEGGDYVVLPASTTHRWVLSDGGPVQALIIEATGRVTIPARYLTERGQLREGAPFSERDIRPPSGPLVIEDEGQVPVLVRSRQGWSRHCHATHPFDVVGWDGCLWPYAFSIRDFEPIVGRIHQPPPVHQTFAGPRFVVCSFVPRLFDLDPEAIKVPYHHANVDSDEVLFYSAGDFMSRKGAGIGVGSFTLHPAGFVHGPQPGSIEAAVDAVRTDETAVMIDTFAPLLVSNGARASADPEYPWSWARRP
jgi:homogentisate 1,2-dioxygenase